MIRPAGMGGVVEGAALGVAFQVFFTSVVDASLKISHFRSQLDRLNSTLSFIKLAMAEVDTFDAILDRPKHEIKAFTDRLSKGEELVHKCSKVNWWNVFKRLYYARELTKLEASIVMFFQTQVAALHFCESKRTSVRMRHLEVKMNEMTDILKRLEDGSCNVNKFELLQEVHHKEMIERVSVAAGNLEVGKEDE